MEGFAHGFIEPNPDPNEIIKQNVGTTSVSLTALGSGLFVAANRLGNKFGLSPHQCDILVGIVIGLIVGAFLMLMIALIVYCYERKHPKDLKMTTSTAFNDALAALVAAANAKVAAAESETTENDTDATAAVVAATAQFTPVTTSTTSTITDPATNLLGS